MLVTNYSENMGPTQTGFQTNTLKSLCDWLALSDSICDWLRLSSSYQFETQYEIQYTTYCMYPTRTAFATMSMI